jgi:hypothetical protein
MGAAGWPCIGAACALASLSFAGAARGETWVVDDDGPANFKDLPDAVAAAQDGDTLVLRPGRYSAASLSRKGLVIVGAGPGCVTIQRRSGEGPFFEARELGARQNLVLAGVTGIGRGKTLVIERCGGLVLLADLVIESRHPSRAGLGPSLSDCSNGVLSRVAVLPGEQPCSGSAFALSLARGNYSLAQVVAVGAPGAPGRSPRGRGGSGGIGISVDAAQVYIACSEFVGGVGGAALWDEAGPFCPEAAIGGPGGAGLFVAGESTLVAAAGGGAALRGGDGGAALPNPWYRCWSFAGDGGPGLRVRDDGADREIALSGVEVLPGAAGEGDASRAGVAGAAIDGFPEAVRTEETVLPTLSVDEPAACGAPATVRVRGPPGGLVTLIVTSKIGRSRLKGKKGFPFQAVPGEFWSLVRLGRIDDSGEILLRGELPIDKTLVGRTFAVQALVATSHLDRRESFLTNVDVLCVADGGSGVAALIER